MENKENTDNTITTEIYYELHYYIYDYFEDDDNDSKNRNIKLRELLDKYRTYTNAPQQYAALMKLIIMAGYGTTSAETIKERVHMLLEAGADPNDTGDEFLRDEDSMDWRNYGQEELPPIHLICAHYFRTEIRKCAIELIELLEKYGADLYAKSGYDSQNSRNALFYSRGHYDLAKYLLGRGVSVYCTEVENILLYNLIDAKPEDYDRFIKLYMEYGVDINKPVFDWLSGDKSVIATPLYYCLRHIYDEDGQKKATALIENGAILTPDIIEKYEKYAEKYPSIERLPNKRYKYEEKKIISYVEFLKPYMDRYYETQQIFKRAPTNLGEPEDEDVSEDEVEDDDIDNDTIDGDL